MKEPNAMSFHVKYKPEDFMPANEEEKQSQVIMREPLRYYCSYDLFLYCACILSL